MANLLRGMAASAVFISLQSLPAKALPARCEAIEGGVEYRAYLPDQKRYVYVSVKALPGYYPSVFVTIDKNYEAGKAKVSPGDPVVVWWLDRSRPMSFSSNEVVIRWASSGTLSAVTSWILTPDAGEVKQPIRGLEPNGPNFNGTGSTDTNSFAFQTRLEMPNFNGDAFDVVLPSVSYDGVTVAPPVVHFTRDGRDNQVKC